MSTRITTSAPVSKILWPRSSIAGCVFCVILRDTRGVALDHDDRFNFFPASPLCCVTWIFAGDCYLIEKPAHFDQPTTGVRVPEIAFSGAQLGPLASWNSGETLAITMIFYPDAFAAMTGLDLSAFTGRFVAAADVLPEPILGACREFAAAARHDTLENGLEALEREVETLWARARPARTRPLHWVRDWTRALVARATVSGPGHSARQAARRLRAWTGASRRDLEVLGHTEQLYARIHAALGKGRIDWAGLAAASGFSDQAHMIRRMRQHTGFTPQQLLDRAGSEEAFWGYRLLRQHFDRAPL